MDYRSINDEDLALASQQGDTFAFQELTHRYIKHIFNFARQYVREHEASEDVTQDSFLKAWKHIKRFKREYSFKSWLFTIARNTALDHIKKKRSIAFSAMDDVDSETRFADSIPDEEPLPAEIFSLKELGARIEKAMEVLPAEHRAVIVMRYRNEMTFEEIAQATGKPMNTVKSWHHRSLAKIRRTLMHQK